MSRVLSGRYPSVPTRRDLYSMATLVETLEPDAGTQRDAPPADAATHVKVTLHGPLPPGTTAQEVIVALVAASGGSWLALDRREVELPSDAVGSTGFAVIAIGTATRLAAKQWVPLGTGRMRLSIAAATPRNGALAPQALGVPGVTVLAASNVPMKRGRGRSGLWHVLVSHGDAAALLARHRCVRFLTDSTYACFDTPGDAAACDEAGMKAPVTIELMRGPVPAHIRSNANAAVDATAVPAHALPRYVWANAKTHVWLAVGQVGFGFAGDDAAVCSMLRRAVASQPLGVPRTQAAGTTVTATAATATTTTKTASAAADANATATDVRSRAAALQKEFPLLTAADVNEFLEGVLAAAQPVTTEAEGRALGIIVAGRRNAAVEADSVVCDGLRACDAAVRERLREVATASNAAPSTHDTGARAPRQLSFADDDPAVRNMLRGLAPHPLGAHIR